jgi:hypothetical protein
MRVKSRWFKSDGPKSPEQNAGAMAFIVWRVARNLLGRMRGARFDIEAGPPYFDFLREVLVFLVHVADRMAWQRMDAGARAAFTTELALRVAAHLDDNATDLLDAPAAGQASHRDRFIDLVNELSAHYAEFGADPAEAGFAPDFGFVRYFASRVAEVLPAKDRLWTMDQLMAVEVPEAVATLRRSFDGLLSAESRPARRSTPDGE